MIALLFIIIVTGLSICISFSLSAEPTWLDYYKGGVLGFFFSGVILYAMNKRRRKKEMEAERR